MAKKAQTTLSIVHAGRRDWPHIVLWTSFLLALPIAFVALLEGTGPSDAEAFDDDCEGVSALTCFVNVSILVWASALIVRRKILPLWWPHTSAAMPAHKAAKAVGYAVKTLFRLAALILLLILLQYWSFDGLRMGGGPVFQDEHNTLLFNRTEALPRSYCQGEHGLARRMWHSSKMFFMAVMVWELSFLPSSSWDMWLHHLGLVLGVAFSTDHRLRQLISGPNAPGQKDGPTVRGEALDGFAYILMLGTAFMFVKELTVLFFQHRKVSKEGQQYHDLMCAAIVHVVGQAAFYLVLPAVYVGVAMQRGSLGAASGLLVGLLVVLNVLEAYIFSVTLKVMHAKRKKAKLTRHRREELRAAGHMARNSTPIADRSAVRDTVSVSDSDTAQRATFGRAGMAPLLDTA